MEEASRMVDRRCAMTRVVRPACSLASASCIMGQGLESKEASKEERI